METAPATLRTGRPVKEVDESTGALILSVIEQINKEGSANSIKEVKRRARLLLGAGSRINKNPDSEANVKYRLKYLERRLGNLEALLNKNKKRFGLPDTRRSFAMSLIATLDHTAPNRWVIPGSTLLSLAIVHCWSSLLRSWYDHSQTRGKGNLQDLKNWAQTEDVQTWLQERGIVIPEKPNKQADIQKYAKLTLTMPPGPSTI
ncbi:hypothetical protein BGZ97_002406 [Linnemannia gamsii]|uniref:Uncharacterized protein n=1 Tax=Linnemannia gamsii TaxID=64522 RepID=A0A9P6QW48_9FUNG|nr:hypothetical protein BGZ97_002406 [Linnemannia gamsii]